VQDTDAEGSVPDVASDWEEEVSEDRFAYADFIEVIGTPERLHWAERHVITSHPHRIGDCLNNEASRHLLRAIREGWGPEGENWRTAQEWRAKHLAQGKWACPACPDGWQQFSMSRDAFSCPVCGYDGGDVVKR
jgi:hypothetical protein